MEDRETRIIAAVTVGKRLVSGNEVPVKNVVQEYFNPQAGRTEWRLIYGFCEVVTSGFQKFESREEALQTLKEFGPLDVTEEQGQG